LKDLTVILLPPDLHLIRKKAGSLDPGVPAAWVYLGRDALFSHALDRELPPLGRIPTGDRLQELAREHRNDYIRFIGGLAARFQGIPWWLTSVSEKNPFYSDLFLDFCRMALCREQAGGREGYLLVICGSRGLREAIQGSLPAGGGLRVEMPDPLSPRLREPARDRLIAFFRISWWMARYLGRILLARIFAPARYGGEGGHREGKLVLIHSWADGRSFTPGGGYSDTFTGALGPELERRSARVAYLISILPTFPYLRGLLALRRARVEYRLTEEFMTVPDLLRAPFTIRGQAVRELEPAVLQGMDLSPLVSEELARDGLHTRRELSWLMYRAARRLGQQIPLRSFVYTFENHLWEKLVCLGLREAAPRTTRIGYAHSIVIPMNLSYSLSGEERGTVPLPDLIAVNGPRAREVLASSGFDPGSIFISGAFRYPGEVEAKMRPRERGEQVVLVALPSGIEESLELAHKSVQALGDPTGCRVVLKCHPSVPPDRLSPYLSPLPPHFSFSTDPVATLLGKAGLVLYTSSTVAVEAAAWGIPVVHVRSDLAIDRNIFDGDPRVPSLATPAGIREAVLGLLGREFSEEEYPGDLVRGLFAPVSEENLEKFLGAP
jgi:hypothetical protein